MKKKVLIAGAGGRDFHNFLTFYKDNPDYLVVGFTATQIPGIAGRIFPSQIAGKSYPKGIPIYDEKDLAHLIKSLKIDEVVLSYSDLSFEYVGHFFSKVLSAGATFRLLGPEQTMIQSKKPVISVCAVRTGCGKSQTSRKVLSVLQRQGYKVGVVRHPMPYGDLNKQRVQKFTSLSDLKKYNATIEEQEEYTKYLEHGASVYAGVDYPSILKLVEKENDIVLWDGGNNDFPFFHTNLHIVVVDPHRAGHEIAYYPGEVNFRMADVIVINKVDSATEPNIHIVEKNIQAHNPRATVIHARSAITLSDPGAIKGKRCLIIGDGPTLTHGGMTFGAGTIAVKKYGGIIVDPRPYAVGSIKAVFEKYDHLHSELPAMGYSKQQLIELEKTANAVPCDLIIDGTPANLGANIRLKKKVIMLDYELDEIGTNTIGRVVGEFLRDKKHK